MKEVEIVFDDGSTAMVRVPTLWTLRDQKIIAIHEIMHPGIGWDECDKFWCKERIPAFVDDIRSQAKWQKSAKAAHSFAVWLGKKMGNGAKRIGMK